MLLHPAALRIKDYMEALRQGRKKLAPAYRFPYFSGQNMVSEKAFEDFVMGLGGRGMSEEAMEQKVRSFGEKYPYVADIFSDLLWHGRENEQANAVEILRMLASERAVATLEAFALSQVGDDDLRVAAAHALMSLGVFTEDKPVRFWLKGQWRDMLLRRQLITEEWELEYSDYIIALLEEATVAFRQGREEEAEEHYKKVRKSC